MENYRIGFYKALGSETKFHAFDENNRPLCGKYSVHFLETPKKEVNCKRCLQKLNK